MVFFAGEGAEPVGGLGDVAGILAEEPGAGLPCDRRAHYFAAAKLLVTVQAWPTGSGCTASTSAALAKAQRRRW